MTSKTDLQGREYASMKLLQADDIVQVDAGFTCIPKNATRTVRQDNHGLFIDCSDGNHYLDGQLDFEDNDRSLFYQRS